MPLLPADGRARVRGQAGNHSPPAAPGNSLDSKRFLLGIMNN
jgi:hypothetical protein